jgi:GH25 family lysozyme M1 (1,4-beta-N-acetylmuramidase)
MRDYVQINPSAGMKAGFYKPKPSSLLRQFLYENAEVQRTLLEILRPLILDISFYQITARFPQMLSNSVSGVIIRAGQNTWVDSSAFTYMTNAKSAGMPFGSYWFYDSRTEPRRQAEMWADVLSGHDAKLWCWADYEENYGGTYGGWRYFADFLEYAKQEMPERKLGVYTGYYYWIEHSPNPITQRASLDYFAQYPLWLAWYTIDPTTVRIPAPWKEMTFWQKSASGDGYKYGVDSREVDMNDFMLGDIQVFKNLFELEGNGGEIPMPEITYTGTVKDTVTAGAIVRSTPNGADSGQRLAANTPIEVQGTLMDAGIYEWANVVSPVQGWVATILLDLEPVSQPVTELPDVLYISTQEDGSDKVKYVKAV